MSSILRKIERNIMKKYEKSNQIKNEWEKYQVFKYGLGQHELIKKANKKKKKK